MGAGIHFLGLEIDAPRLGYRSKLPISGHDILLRTVLLLEYLDMKESTAQSGITWYEMGTTKKKLIRVHSWDFKQDLQHLFLVVVSFT